ncbi:MAG: hypothetical protein KFH87_11750 [Bacteroidetes bacterium]|nr:hypothetical protein [Bacteroidota bacterium]
MSNVAHGERRWDDTLLRASLMLLLFAGVLWLGGTVYRAVIANELFISGTLEYDPAVQPAQEQMLYQLIFATSLIVLISYLVTLVSTILVLWRIPLRFKDNGWLMMAAILVFAFVPVELFTSYLDIHFMYMWDWTKDAIAENGPGAFIEMQTELRKTLSHRIGALGGLPVMALLCYMTAAVVIIWQPMRRSYEAGTTDNLENN